MAASLLVSKGTFAAPAQAPGMGASVTPAQAQAAVATAKQVNPAGVAGLSAAVNSKTAVCSIPAGSKGGKLINAPTLENTAAAGAAAVAPPPLASASGRRLLEAACFVCWFNDVGSAISSAVGTVKDVANDAAEAIGNAATSAASTVVKGLDTAGQATATGVVDAARATTSFVEQQSNNIKTATNTLQVLNQVNSPASDLTEAAQAAIPPGEALGEAGELALAGAELAGKRRSLLTTEPLSLQSGRRLLAPALAPPAPNTQSTSSMFGSAGKMVTVPASVQAATIPACCQTTTLPAGATAASLEQQNGLPTDSVSFINADNAFSTPGGNITVPCPRFLAWFAAVQLGISVALSAPM